MSRMSNLLKKQVLFASPVVPEGQAAGKAAVEVCVTRVTATPTSFRAASNPKVLQAITHVNPHVKADGRGPSSRTESFPTATESVTSPAAPGLFVAWRSRPNSTSNRHWVPRACVTWFSLP